MENKGYSIWLMPEDEINEKLSKTISKLCRKYNCPIFNPHVTLIGKIDADEEEIIKKAKKLAKKIKPFEIKLSHPECLENYFKCLFMKVEETEEVMSAGKLALEHFNLNGIYFPHLSLVYGNFNPSLKKPLMQIGNLLKGLKFKVRYLYIYQTEKYAENRKIQIQNWEKIAKIPLS